MFGKVQIFVSCTFTMRKNRTSITQLYIFIALVKLNVFLILKACVYLPVCSKQGPDSNNIVSLFNIIDTKTDLIENALFRQIKCFAYLCIEMKGRKLTTQKIRTRTFFSMSLYILKSLKSNIPLISSN